MAKVKLHAALAAPRAQRGALLLDLAENQWFDRKSARIRPPKLAEALVGFANAEGGTIVIGLHDGRVEGIDSAGPAMESAWRQTAIDFTMPVVPCEFQMIDCVNHTGDADHLFVIRAETTGVVHSLTDDTVHLRVGDETRKLRFDQRRELLAEKGQATFEASVLPGLTVDDLDSDLLDEYASAVGSSDANRLLATRSLLTLDGRVTMAAALLFAPWPQTWLPQADVRILRYAGRARGTGSRQQLVSDERIGGPLPRQLAEARDAIERVLPTRRALGPEGLFRDVPMVPEAAWLEGLVNAVVHRSYSYSGDHIRVEVFDDRVEVSNPGRFPDLTDASDPRDVMRFSRNPRIARTCSELQFGQELGEGIRRMFDEMRRAGLADPDFHQSSSSVRLTLSSSVVRSELEMQLMSRQRELLGLLRRYEGLSTGDLVEVTGWSRPAVLRDLGHLRDLELIEWVGRSRTDPRAFWLAMDQTD